MTNKVVNKKYLTKVRVYEDFVQPPELTIGKNKNEVLKRLKPYHTNNPGKIISPLYLLLRESSKKLRRKINKFFKRK